MTPHSGLASDSAGGILLVVAVVLPVAGILLSLVLGGRDAERIARFVLCAMLATAAAILAAICQEGQSLTYLVGNWNPPLGITLRADGLSAALMVTTALVTCAVAVFAHADMRAPDGVTEARTSLAFWILLQAVGGAMNMVCLAGDLFTLYVGLELLTFAAVPLVSLDGRAETLAAALRYLLFAMLGSLLYLLGVVLLYAAYGTLDVAMLSHAVRTDAVTVLALTLATAGLLAKTALFPFHQWLPPAHAGAPAAASAVLSALVIKGSFFLVIRLWLDVTPRVPGLTGTQILGGLGAAAILFGGIMALRQQRLKLLVAYSTVAQIGYLFLLFPLAWNPASAQLESGAALAGGLLQAISHATAKAGMFMAAGLIYAALGHDRIDGLAGIGRALPLTLLAFACGGFSLIGLPPGGGFLAKSLLLTSPAATTQWWWDWIMSAGSVLTSAYMALILLRSLTPAPAPLQARVSVAPYRQMTALALGLTSLLLGFAAFGAVDIFQIGRPFTGPIPLVGDPDGLFTPAAIWKAIWPTAVGSLLAIGILRLESQPLRTNVQGTGKR